MSSFYASTEFNERGGWTTGCWTLDSGHCSVSAVSHTSHASHASPVVTTPIPQLALFRMGDTDYQYNVPVWYPIMLDTKCHPPDCGMWFVGQDDGIPSCDDMCLELHSLQLYFSNHPITHPVCSVKQERAACRIQRAWRHAISDPSHIICRNRLVREFCGFAFATAPTLQRESWSGAGMLVPYYS